MLAIGLFEGTNISEGRGTDNPFKYIGAPWIDSNSLMNYINDLKKNIPEYYSIHSVANLHSGLHYNCL